MASSDWCASSSRADAGADGRGRGVDGCGAGLRGHLGDVATSDWLVPLRADDLIWSVDTRSNGCGASRPYVLQRGCQSYSDDLIYGGAMASDELFANTTKEMGGLIPEDAGDRGEDDGDDDVDADELLIR